ncbi:MAG: ADP-ribosylglycohydrolase family protein [Lentisphaeria bacterium]|nr:ADP-ribosylglycohydrolase family protein [Lentisphaeria bacterium]
MAPLGDYEQQVYAGVLGKVIGVYMGRPFEGWAKARLEERFGQVDRYVHEDLGKPLVVPDDDISGTLTFVRALEDSGLYADTPTDFFGDTWLNYLIEGRTVLWWGGLGHSTEHTAYLRLKHGLRAPASGAIATNGRTVAEQIGAQIFIDAFGMVAPGRPELAAELARRSASVSHDGEAVHAAVIVAGMISAAFTEKRIERLLDLGVSLAPRDCLIARVHRDVRAWCRTDGDWRRTYGRIADAYGYSRYGGNCHVVPNHAVMVMAWSYAPDDFHRAQLIVNTAGWDTDCNAANVGALMGLVVGLNRIAERYDFRSPMADRIILPTAEGTRGVSDCLAEALHIARIGRRVMGWPDAPAPKHGAWHHFAFPGAVHGYMAEEERFENRGAATVGNDLLPGTDERALRLDFRVSAGRTAVVSTPVLPPTIGGGYGIQATPRLYAGMSVRARCTVAKLAGDARACLFVRTVDADAAGRVHCGEWTSLGPEKELVLAIAVPAAGGMPVRDFGIRVAASAVATGTLTCSRVDFEGVPSLSWPDGPPLVNGSFPGWIVHADVLRGPFSDDRETVRHAGRNEGRGVLVTGNTDWRDMTFSARVCVHLADRAGILVHYQGLERYLALVKTRTSLQFLRRWYGNDQVLAEVPADWEADALHELRIVCRGDQVAASCDGMAVAETTDERLDRGGAGFVFENGLMGFRDVAVGG